jgi:hypothetical protein
MQHVSPNRNDFMTDYIAAQRTPEDTAVPQKPLDLNCRLAKCEYFTRWVEFFKLKLVEVRWFACEGTCEEAVGAL